jgi:hypothetical protein
MIELFYSAQEWNAGKGLDTISGWRLRGGPQLYWILGSAPG